MNKAASDKIRFHFLTKQFNFPRRTELKTFLLKKLKKEGKQVEAINYIFCDDNYLLEVNKKYLNHDTFTDIITFELSPRERPLISDIYISTDRVRDNAKQFKNTFQRELHRVIFHGALHLAGYKDKTAKDEVVMRAKEEEYLLSYFVPRGTTRN